MFSKHSIMILDTSETQDIISFAGRSHWLEIQFTYCVLQEEVFRCERRGYLLTEYEWVDSVLSTLDTLF